MHKKQSALLGVSKNSHAEYQHCRNKGCIRRVSGGAIIRQAERIYQSWKEAVCDLLRLSEKEYEEKVERKKQYIGFEVYLQTFFQFLEARGDEWDIASFISYNRSADKGLSNYRKQLTFLEDCFGDFMWAAYCEYCFKNSDLTLEEFRETELSEKATLARRKRTSNLAARLEGYKFQEFVKFVFEAHDLVEGEDFLYEKFMNTNLCIERSHSRKCRETRCD